MLEDWQRFLRHLKKLELLDAHQMKPVVDGKQLAKEVGKNPGPWMKEAIRALIRWQFQNPKDDSAVGVRTIVDRVSRGDIS